MKTLPLSIIATLAGILACEQPPDCPAPAPGADTAPVPSPGSGSGAANGTSGAAGACSIPCLAGVGEDCFASGRCITQASGTGSSICCSNGVKVAQKSATLPSSPTVTTYYKPDGKICYVVEAAVDPGSGAIMMTWKDSAGGVLATGSSPGGIGKIAISCQGKTYDMFTSGCFSRSGQLGGGDTMEP